MWKHTKRQHEFLFSNMRFIVIPLTAVCVLCLIKLRWPRKRTIYLVHSYGWIPNNTGGKIPVFYWNKDCLCSSLLWVKENKPKIYPANVVPALWFASTVPLNQRRFFSPHLIFQLWNPGLFYLIPLFKPGTAEHSEELTVCSQVGWTT